MGKMAGILPQRLPGSTFAKYMLLEARSVALSHLKEEIHSAEGNLTVRLLRESYKKMKSTKKIINRSIPLLLIVCQSFPITNYVWQGLLSPFRQKGYKLLNLTVGPDGTTKFGKHYGAISISLSGKTMCMGMRDMACGDAEAYQKLLEGIVEAYLSF
jgi:hypothetical protein